MFKIQHASLLSTVVWILRHSITIQMPIAKMEMYVFQQYKIKYNLYFPKVYGCTDTDAKNFDASANVNRGCVQYVIIFKKYFF